MAKSYLNNASFPRGIRNNNPGNLVISSIAWLGKIPVSQNKDGHFEQFTELRYGIRAMMRDIITDVNKGKSTIKKLISEYAPAFENNTASYMNVVAEKVGISIDAQIASLSKELLIGLCKAIVLVENGANYTAYISDKDYEEAYAVLGITLPSKKK